MDYQACIQARKTGNDQEVAKRCDQIWNEIRNNNNKYVIARWHAPPGFFKKSQPFGWLRV
jgi:hypothetical protein